VEVAEKGQTSDLALIWSSEGYKKYETAKWDWWNLPFTHRLCADKFDFAAPKSKIYGKILEIGSAMGQAYRFLKESALVDVSQYTGIEVSRFGHQYCRKNFPEAQWLHEDFTEYTLSDTYDYTFERHAIHHMRDPLEQLRKMVSHTRLVVLTSFRGWLDAPTFSDIRRGRFNTLNGAYHLNLINPLELVKMAIDCHFNHVHVLYGGDHEPISGDPNTSMYLARDVQERGGSIMRLIVRISRCKNGHAPRISVGTKGLRQRFSPRLVILKRRMIEAFP
jgi:SAM-dependent methyltransferase